MKRTTVWLFITLLTFILGITATFLYLELNSFNKQNKENMTNHASIDNSKETAEIPTLNYCELSDNPEEYEGKVVRLNAILKFGTEGAWFSYSKCFTTKGTTLVFFSKNKQSWKIVEAARKEKPNEPWANELNVTVIGKFKNLDPKNCCIIASSQFEIQEVERASKINQENN